MMAICGLKPSATASLYGINNVDVLVLKHHGKAGWDTVYIWWDIVNSADGCMIHASSSNFEHVGVLDHHHLMAKTLICT